ARIRVVPAGLGRTGQDPSEQENENTREHQGRNAGNLAMFRKLSHCMKRFFPAAALGSIPWAKHAPKYPPMCCHCHLSDPPALLWRNRRQPGESFGRILFTIDFQGKTVSWQGLWQVRRGAFLAGDSRFQPVMIPQ